MSKVNETTFSQCVRYARVLVPFIRELYGERLADVWMHRYACDCAGDDRNVFIHELIMCSAKESEACKALQMIVFYHLRNETPLPQSLDLWTPRAAGEFRRELKSRRTDAYTNFVRDMAIVVVVLLLTGVEDIKAIRSIDGFSECGYEGGSACDVVGEALWDLSGLPLAKSLKYKRIEAIWTATSSPDSPLYRYGPSRRPFIEHPRFLLMDPKKHDGRSGPPENLMEFSTPFRILGDVLSAFENNEEQSSG